MDTFQVTCLRYTLEAQDVIRFGEQSGSQLRGGLYNALREMLHVGQHHLADPQHRAICPLCSMMERENAEGARGRTVPRPFGLLPPNEHDYASGQRFSIGLNLYGDTHQNYPMITLALSRLGQIGVGYGRGRFRLHRIENLDPLTGQAIELFSVGQVASTLPQITIGKAGVRTYSVQLPTDQLTLQFLTPLRLVDHDRLVKEFHFRPLIARLLERLEGLEHEYANGGRWEERYRHLAAAADGINLLADHTSWHDVESGSRRQGRMLPIGGLVGTVTIQGDLTPFREWLVWGSLTQVGKNVVKGCGWYQICTSS